MDPSLLARLLAPAFLAERMAPHLALQGATLQSTTPRDIDAPGYLSDLTGVLLDWRGAVAPGTPARAVLKVSHAGFGQQELPFYETIAARFASPVVPRFFAGGVDEATGRTWLLMEDLSESHMRPSEAPLPPTLERNLQIVEALARFHALGLDGGGAPLPGTSFWDRLRASDWLEGACQRLLAQAGDALDGRREAMYAQFLRSFPALVQRADQLAQRTLVHGDAHVWNWMVPREGTAGVARLIDWDGWHLGVGVVDLAYMMAVQWDRGVRARFEMPLLDRYHATLTESGVAGYTRAALQQDYRLAVLLHLRTPLARFARGMSAYVWWPQIGRITDAVEDLGCMELLG